MNKSLSELYTQVVLNEAEKHQLQNPTSDEVGNLKVKQDLFGTKPKPVEGAEKAKLDKGPSYKETTGSTSASKSSGKPFAKSAPAKSPDVEEGEEMEDTEVSSKTDSKEQDKPSKKKQLEQESFTMSAFEQLFKKTITEEIGQEPEMEQGEGMGAEEGVDNIGTEEPVGEAAEEGLEEEEGDLISDLKDLHDRLGEILSKLEGVQEEEEALEGEEEGYSEDDFDDEFADEGEEDEEGSAMKESLDKPKVLGDKKKALQHKKNKVGKLSAKGGKAHTGNVKTSPSPSNLGDKKKALQSKGNQVRSSVKKGEFFK